MTVSEREATAGADAETAFARMAVSLTKKVVIAVSDPPILMAIVGKTEAPYPEKKKKGNAFTSVFGLKKNTNRFR